jgi:hypothetical protein
MKSQKRENKKKALSYLLLALYVGQQLMPDLLKQYPDVKWLAGAAAVLGLFYRAYGYWQTAHLVIPGEGGAPLQDK